MKTLIRYATSRDFPILLSIDQACFPPEIAYDALDLKHMMSRAGAETLVLEEEDTIVAFLVMEVDRRRKTATLVTLDVLSGQRRRGYATSLLARSESMLTDHGVATYNLQVDTKNDAAISFYRRNGFEMERLLRKYYPGSRDAWQMVKKLRPSGDT
ncbi:MAG TPA: GNAT family N-acetyltransferase [Terriglobia bacterium]|nr:GNAT family N-acetyltransferase [Terriglobia bacterium]